MPMYEIRVNGNVPVSVHGLYHRSGESPEDAKRSLAYYFRSNDNGKKNAVSTSVDVLVAHMTARKV